MKTKTAIKETHEKILDLWLEGKSSPEIINEIPDVTDKLISNVLWRARKRNDPRAVFRRNDRVGNFAGRPWTKNEIKRAVALRRKKLSCTQIGEILKRTGKAVEAKLNFYDGDGKSVIERVHERVAIPPSVEALRDRRLAVAPRDLTAAYFGDPLPGLSALDRRVAA